MEDKPWLKSYPPDMPATIDIGEYTSLNEVVAESIDKYRHQTAFTNMGKSISYDDVDRQSRNFAAWLQHELGLEAGDRIALMMPNLLQYPIALFGALRAGLTVVNTNPLYTDRELKHQLNDSGARAIVIVEAFAHTLSDVIQETSVEHVILTRFGDRLGWLKGTLVNFVIRHVKKMVPPFSLPGAHRFNDALTRGASLPEPIANSGLDDIAFLQYTGGTTGVAKGAMLTHSNLLHNVTQADQWLTTAEIQYGKELIVTALPLYHVFALTANLFTYFRIGSQNLLITNPRDIKGFIKELGKYQMTSFTGVNTLFNALLNDPEFGALDFSKFRVSLGGGMAVQQTVADRWQAVTGATLVEAYGLTETSPAAVINPMSIDGYNDSIGLPLPSTECRILDENGKALGPNEPGELCIRGPQVMAGYWQNEEATAKSIDADGFFHTGDIAIMRENGYIKIVDRLKDMVLVSGFNVYPNEVEAVIAELDGVLECGVIGVPDERTGEAVKAVIVRSDPGLTEQQIKDHCVENLTNYKRPKIIQFVDELPKTNVGKILRRALRDL